MCAPLAVLAPIIGSVVGAGSTVVGAVNQARAQGDAQAVQKDQSEKALAAQKNQQAASMQDPNLQLTAQKNRDAIAKMRMGTPSTIVAAGGGGMGSPPPVGTPPITGGVTMPANPQMMTAMAIKQRTGQ